MDHNNAIRSLWPELVPLHKKDHSDPQPADRSDANKVLKKLYAEENFQDMLHNAFKAVGPLLMMAVHAIVPMCLLNNPDKYAQI